MAHVGHTHTSIVLQLLSPSRAALSEHALCTCRVLQPLSLLTVSHTPCHLPSTNPSHSVLALIGAYLAVIISLDNMACDNVPGSPPLCYSYANVELVLSADKVSHHTFFVTVC